MQKDRACAFAPSPTLPHSRLRACPLPANLKMRPNPGRAGFGWGRECTESAASAAVAQDEAGAAGAANAAAQRFGGGARVGTHAHLVERLRPAAAQDRAEQARIAPGEKLG